MSAKFVFGDINSITSKLHTLRDQLISIPEHAQLTQLQLQDMFATTFGWASFDEMASWQGNIKSTEEYVFVDAPNRFVAFEQIKMEMRMRLAKTIVNSNPAEIAYTEIMNLMDILWRETSHVSLPNQDVLPDNYILDSIYMETIVPCQYSRFIKTHILPKLASNGGVLFCYDHDFNEQCYHLKSLGAKPLVLNTTSHQLSNEPCQEVHLMHGDDVDFVTELLSSIVSTQNIDNEHLSKALSIITAYTKSKYIASSINPMEKLLAPITTESLIAGYNSLNSMDKRNVTHSLIDIGVDVINDQAITSSMVTIQSTPLGELLFGMFELVARLFEPQSEMSKGMTINEMLELDMPLMVLTSCEKDEDTHVACLFASAIRSCLLSRIIDCSKTGNYEQVNKKYKTICLPHDADFLPNGFYNMVHLLANINFGIVAGGDNQRDPDKDVFYSYTCRNTSELQANVDTLGGFLPKRQGISGLFKKREFQPALYSKRHAKNILSVANLDMSVESSLKRSNIDVLLLK